MSRLPHPVIRAILVRPKNATRATPVQLKNVTLAILVRLKNATRATLAQPKRKTLVSLH